MADISQTFTEAKLKVQWAKRHIYKLVDEYCALLNSDFAKLAIESDTHTGHQRVKILPIADFPTDIPLIIGDTAHNLRTAFDHIVAALPVKTG